jgi:prepilin-type N-terminal cleavage/methylation domain-containing protein
MSLLTFQRKPRPKRRRSFQGFTLVELAIAVGVIGLITAIAIPVYGGVQSNARFRSLDEQVKRAHEASVINLESGEGSIASVIDRMNNQSDQIVLSYRGATKNDICVFGKWKTGSFNVPVVQRGPGCDGTPMPEVSSSPSSAPSIPAPVATSAPAPPVENPTTQLPIEGSGTATRGNLTVTAKNVDKWPLGYRITLDATMANNPKLADVWTVSWPDPLAKSANGNDGFNCVVNDGVVSCTTTGWLVNAFKWADRVDMSQLSIQIQSSDGYTSPNRPKLSLK